MFRTKYSYVHCAWRTYCPASACKLCLQMSSDETTCGTAGPTTSGQPSLTNYSERILPADTDDRVNPGQDRGEMILILSWSAARAGGSSIKGPKKGKLQEAAQFQAEGRWSRGHLQSQVGWNFGPGRGRHRYHTVWPCYSACSLMRGQKPTQKLGAHRQTAEMYSSSWLFRTLQPRQCVMVFVIITLPLLESENCELTFCFLHRIGTRIRSCCCWTLSTGHPVSSLHRMVSHVPITVGFCLVTNGYICLWVMGGVRVKWLTAM